MMIHARLNVTTFSLPQFTLLCTHSWI